MCADHLPAASSYDPEGKPLLSWRVYVLPHMEQQALFNQFHLDEPWDSEHNRKLIDQMPELFADPDPEFARRSATKAARPTSSPVGEDLLFGSKEGLTFKEMIDGTSEYDPRGGSRPRAGGRLDEAGRLGG